MTAKALTLCLLLPLTAQGQTAREHIAAAQKSLDAAVKALDEVTPTPEPEPQPEPEPPVQVGSVYGDFILQPLFHGDNDKTPPRGTRLVSEAQLKMPGVSGLTIRIIPKFFEVNGKWDFTFIDQCVQRCRNTNRRYKLLLAGGEADPLTAKSQTFYRAAHAALGARYGNDPLFVGAHCTGGSLPGHSEELFTGGGKMPRALIDWNKDLIDVCTAAYPRQVKLLAHSANDPAAMRELILYGIQKTDGAFLVKSNAMQAKPNLDWEGNQLVVFCAKNGGMMGWEMVSPSVNQQRFGGTYDAMLKKVDTLTAQGGKKRGERMLDHYAPDINQLAKIQ